jgi:hypothetical protein
MEKNLGPGIALRSIHKILQFSDKSLKNGAQVCLLLVVSLFAVPEKSYSKCPEFLARFVAYISHPKLEVIGSKVKVRDVGFIHQSTYNLAHSLGLIDSGEQMSRWYHHRKAQELSRSPIFRKLLKDLEQQYGVPTALKLRAFRLRKSWSDLIHLLDSVVTEPKFRTHIELLAGQLRATYEQTLELTFFENSYSPQKLFEMTPLIHSEMERLGLSGYSGLSVVLPLHSHGTLKSVQTGRLSFFLLKSGHSYQSFLNEWSTRFPSISFDEIEVLWPHVLAASKILRENRQFLVDPLEFLARVHSVDSTLSATLEKFGFFPESSPDSIRFVRDELRGWKQKFLNAKKDRQFLNPHVTQDVLKNYMNDSFTNIASEIVWSLYYQAPFGEKVIRSIRNLISDVLTDFILNVSAPDSASRIMKETLGGPEKLAALERFIAKYNELGAITKDQEDSLLKDLWVELNPKNKHLSNLTTEQIEEQIRQSGFWSDLKGHVSKTEFFRDWIYQTYLQSTVMVPVGMAFGAAGEIAQLTALEEEVTLDEVLTAALFGAAGNFIYYGFWAAPRYALLYKFYPERIARVLYRKGIKSSSPEYESLRARMMARAGLFNAVAFDSLAYPVYISGFTWLFKDPE